MNLSYNRQPCNLSKINSRLDNIFCCTADSKYQWQISCNELFPIHSSNTICTNESNTKLTEQWFTYNYITSSRARNFHYGKVRGSARRYMNSDCAHPSCCQYSVRKSQARSQVSAEGQETHDPCWPDAGGGSVNRWMDGWTDGLRSSSVFL